MTTKTETTQSFFNMNPWIDTMKSMGLDTHNGYAKQWMDTMDRYGEQMTSFNQMVVARTGEAIDEMYKLTREGFNRSTEYLQFVSELANTQLKNVRESFKL